MQMRYCTVILFPPGILPLWYLKVEVCLPVRTGWDMNVIDDIDVIALDSEFLQQRLHPKKQTSTH